MTYRVAIVGTGLPGSHDGEGAGMAYRHAAGYRRLPNCRLVACADLVADNAARFAERVGIDPAHVYTDYETMLRVARPHIVSVCVPPAAHAAVVIGCAAAPSVRAIHCEKPMATTWRDCLAMVDACEAAGVQLTFNHQRRFARPVTRAKELLDSGAIGHLQRVELGGKNLYDYGIHFLDLCGLFTGGAPVESVDAAVNYDRENLRYGVPNETRARARWRYADGVVGVADTGDGSAMDCHLRLVGSAGELELGCDDGTSLRLRPGGSAAWTVVDTDSETIHGPTRGLRDALRRRLGQWRPGDPTPASRPSTLVERAIADVVTALDTGRPSPLGVDNALGATELVFACWESARRGEPVALPLDIRDNPLAEMIADGEFEAPVASLSSAAT